MESIKNFPSQSEFPNRVNVLLCELCLPRSSGRWYWGAFAGGPAARDLFVPDEVLIITAYEPDPAEWEPDCKTRKEGYYGSITSLLKLILVETGIWDDIPQPSFPRTRESSSDPE